MKLSEIFNENTKGIMLKGIETKEGFFYMNPNDKTGMIEFGIVTNTGFIPCEMFSYCPEMSFEQNLEGMFELMYDFYGYLE